MDESYEVTWFPSYGPEMRGGTANCTVIIADEEIGAPLVRNPTAAIAMNLPSLDKYEPLVKTDGLLVVNQSMVDRGVERTGIKSVLVPGVEIAEKIGSSRVLNMVMLGALLSNLSVTSIEAVEKAMEKHTPERNRKFIPMNIVAMHEGAKFTAS